MAADPQTSPTSSQLLKLPGELRNQILRNLVTQQEPIRFYNAIPNHRLEPNILRVCHQLRDEAMFIYNRENTLDIKVDSRNTIASMHFSRHHSISEYRAKEAIEEIVTVFLHRFHRFQFSFEDTKRLDSFRKSIWMVKDHFRGKHISVTLPPLKSLSSETAQPSSRRGKYPQINSPTSVFSVIRCKSFSVVAFYPGQDLTQYDTLRDLVTSERPVVNMAKTYEDIQRSARALDKMLLPLNMSVEEFDTLRADLFEHTWTMCEAANVSDQDRFSEATRMFEEGYRQLQDVA